MSSIGEISRTRLAHARRIVSASGFRSSQCVFCFHTAHDYRSNTADGDSCFRDLFVICSTNSGKTDFRDRLRFSRADFAIVVRQACGIAWQTNPRQQFVRRDVHLFVAGVKTLIRKPARSARRYEFDLSVVRQQRGRRIRGW